MRAIEALWWKVYVYDINMRGIRQYNIFNHSGFCNSLYKEFASVTETDTLPSYEEVEKILEKELRYYFWGKCEWEVVISSFPPSDKDKDLKVDVYSQVMLNFEKFVSYVYSCLFHDTDETGKTPEEILFGKDIPEQGDLLYWAFEDGFVESLIYDHVEWIDDDVDDDDELQFTIFGTWETSPERKVSELGRLSRNAFNNYLFNDNIKAYKAAIKFYEEENHDDE